MDGEAFPLISAGECSVCFDAGDAVFVQRKSDGLLFFVCPDCGCAWERRPTPGVVETIDEPIKFAPDGWRVATRAEIAEAGQLPLIWRECAHDESTFDRLRGFSRRGSRGSRRSTGSIAEDSLTLRRWTVGRLMFALFKRLRRAAQSEPTRIIVDSAGLVVKHPDGREFAVRWDDVVAVFSYKLDRWTTDEVILQFQQASTPDRLLNISEDWPGFHDLFAPMREHLGVTAEWYGETTRKPFETDLRTLFDRRAKVAPSLPVTNKPDGPGSFR